AEEEESASSCWRTLDWPCLLLVKHYLLLNPATLELGQRSMLPQRQWTMEALLFQTPFGGDVLYGTGSNYLYKLNEDKEDTKEMV
ncbi:unnamed protein product, partial [Choristocarpus tenellus]